MCVDMEFLFECSTWYLTRSLCSHVRYQLELEEKFHTQKNQWFFNHTGAPLSIFLRDYVTIAMVVFWWLLFSENKMLFSCYFCMWNNIYFHLWKYHVHPRKLAWCFTGVYLINSIYLSKQWSHLCTIIYGKY